MAKDYYQILGVEKNASKEDIKKAFHKLAHKYHPDKKGGDEAKFKEVSEAYSVLSDDQKRSQYDTWGSTTSNGNSGFQGFDFSNFSGFQNGHGTQFDFGDLNDVFGDFFGGQRTQRTERGRDISIDLTVDFIEAAFGTNRSVLITKNLICKICKGDGGKPGTEKITCKTCNGNGKIHETKKSFFGVVSVTRACEACSGSGRIPKEKCSGCGGIGIEKGEEEIKVSIPQGIEDGEVIRLSGKGEAITSGIPGDLYARIHVKPHKTLRRDGVNLLTDANIKLSDALLGCDKNIDTLEGEITIKIPEGVSFNETLRVKNKGIPFGNGKRGDIHVKINITLPKKLSKSTRQTIEQLRKEGL
jgi:molecular chaperone DnaJ